MPALECRSGHLNDEEWRYCSECGALLHGEPEESRPEPAPGRPTAHPATLFDRLEHEYVFALAIVFVALAIAATSFVVVLEHHSSGAAAKVASQGSTPVSGTAGGNVKAEALAVNQLLVAGKGDRSSVQAAVAAIASCADVPGAERSLLSAASGRERLVSELGQLDLSALPTSMVDDLISSWLNSIDSDMSYAEWGKDKQAAGCSPNDYADPNYQSAVITDGRASTSKGAFLALWDPLAQRDGLPAWQESQL